MFSNLTTTDIFLLLVSLVVSVSIHEAMHGFAAHYLGDTTAQEAGRLTLNPLKHIDLLTTILLPFILIITTGFPFMAAKPVPFNPYRLRYGEYGTAIVGVAGPLTNLALAVVAAGGLRLVGGGSSLTQMLIIFTEVNIALFVFNMIPFPPLDGSRLLYAFAPEGLKEVMLRIESMGFIPVLIIIFILFRFVAGTIASIDNSLFNFLVG